MTASTTFTDLTTVIEADWLNAVDDFTFGPGWLSVSNYASLGAAVTAMGATQGTLLLGSAIVLTANVTIPATCALMVLKGGQITTTGYTLTINGPVSAGDYQIFAGTGTVVGLKIVNGRWFGMNGDDGTTDNTVPWQAAISACATYKSTLILPEDNGFYHFSSGVTFPSTLDVFKIIWDARMKYTGTSGTAVAFGNSTRFDFLAIQGRGLWVEAVTTVWANNVVGTLWYGCFYAAVTVQRITGFVAGMKFVGDSSYATEYAKFYLTQVLDNKIDIYFAGVADNQNTFIGGTSCATNSAHVGELSGSAGIYISDNNNANAFFNTSLEAVGSGTKEYNVWCGGDYNAWYNCRWEGAGSKCIVFFDTTSVENMLDGGAETPDPRQNNLIVDLGSRNRGRSGYYTWDAGEVTYRPTGGTLTKPTTGNWQLNDRCLAQTALLGRETGYICTTRGTFGTLNGGATTGSITNGSNLLTVSSVADMARNNFITIAGVLGGASYKIKDINGMVVSLNGNADATVAGAAVAYGVPVLIGFGHAYDVLPLLYASNEGYITWDPGSIADGDAETSPAVLVTGLDFNYAISFVRPPYSMQGLTLTGYVNAAGDARIQLANNTGGAINLANGIWYVKAIRVFNT